MSDQDRPDGPGEPEDNLIFNDNGAMNPDHPLLARAQEALKRQLQANKFRLEEDLREKRNALKVLLTKDGGMHLRVLLLPVLTRAHAVQLYNYAWTLVPQAAKDKRENIGVELYGFQQNLAKLQLSLEQTHQNYQMINKIRTQVRIHGTFLSLGMGGLHAKVAINTNMQLYISPPKTTTLLYKKGTESAGHGQPLHASTPCIQSTCHKVVLE